MSTSKVLLLYGLLYVQRAKFQGPLEKGQREQMEGNGGNKGGIDQERGW